jgi:small GTP-binding protein
MEPLLKKYKVLIIGNSCVGKTSILCRHVDGKFSEEVPGTIGVDYRSNAYIRDGKRYDLQVWDTAGQERFRNVTRAYYRDANAALLVFDLSDHASFENIPMWHSQLLEQSGRDRKELVIILIGNKSDLNHEVQLSEIQVLASKLNISTYIQTSAKKGDRVNEVFDQLLEKLITKGGPGFIPESLRAGIVKVDVAPGKMKQRCC